MVGKVLEVLEREAVVPNLHGRYPAIHEANFQAFQRARGRKP